MAMTLIPAVDVLEDEAVRLERGSFDSVTNRRPDPAALIRQFAAAGAPLIHVVDLTGARSGRLRRDLILRLAEAAAPAHIQASGGVRSVEDAVELLDAGATRVVVATAAWAEPTALARFAEALGDTLVVAIDVRDGRLAVSGWERVTDLDATAAAARCEEAGVARVLCTAIDRDGTLGGPDLALLRRLRSAVDLPLLAAGGVRHELDLAELAATGCEAAIVGRALLEGGIPLSALAAPAAG